MTSDGGLTHFQHVHMTGARFEGGVLPIGAVEELRKYQTLIERVAKQVFLKENPGRKRVSKQDVGVLQFELAITEISEGCVGIDLGIHRSATPRLLDSDVIEEAEAIVRDALAEIAQEKTLPERFPPSCLPDLADLGSSLEPGETVILARTKALWADSQSKFTRHSGTKLRELLASAEPGDFEDVLHVHVSGVRTDPQKFYYQEEDSERNHEGSFRAPEMFERLHSVCGFANRSPLVALSLLRQGDAQKRVVDVLNVEVLLPDSWSNRLQELAELRPGWLDGSGQPPTRQSIQAAEALLFALIESRLPRPGIFPTPEGGIQMEWRESADLEVQVSGSGSILLFADDEDDNGFLASANLIAARVREVLRPNGTA